MNPDYRPMPDEIRENLIRFAREAWRNDGAEGESVHRLCDELEYAVADRERWKRGAEIHHRQWAAKCKELECAVRERSDLEVLLGQVYVAGKLSPGEQSTVAWSDHIAVQGLLRLVEQRDDAIARYEKAERHERENHHDYEQAKKASRVAEADAAESRAWYQTAIELKKKLVAAEEELSRLRTVPGPVLSFVSNGEAGDGQHVCTCCGEERDWPHTWEECAKRLADMNEKADGAYWDAVHERDEAEQRYLDIMTIVDYVPPSLSPGWGEFLRKIQARRGVQGNDGGGV